MNQEQIETILKHLKQHAEQIAKDLENEFTRAEILHFLAVHAPTTLHDLMKQEPVYEGDTNASDN